MGLGVMINERHAYSVFDFNFWYLQYGTYSDIVRLFLMSGIVIEAVAYIHSTECSL